eukprot:338473-Pleurochrysis_carterae.AAC.1
MAKAEERLCKLQRSARSLLALNPDGRIRNVQTQASRCFRSSGSGLVARLTGGPENRKNDEAVADVRVPKIRGTRAHFRFSTYFILLRRAHAS